MKNEKRYLAMVICILLIASFFMPWAKPSTSIDLSFASFYGFDNVLQSLYQRTSMYNIISFINTLLELDVTGEGAILKIINIYWLIPLSSLITFIFIGLKKEKLSSILFKLNSIICTILAISPMLLYFLLDEELKQVFSFIGSPSIGYLLTLIAAVGGIFVSFFLKESAFKKELVTNTTDNMQQNSQSTYENVTTSESAKKINENLSKIKTQVVSVSKNIAEVSANDIKSKTFKEISFLAVSILYVLIGLTCLFSKQWMSFVFAGLFAFASGFIYLKYRFKFSQSISSKIENLMSAFNSLYDEIKLPSFIDENVKIIAGVGFSLLALDAFNLISNWHAQNLFAGFGYMLIVISFLLFAFKADFKGISYLTCGYCGYIVISILLSSFSTITYVSIRLGLKLISYLFVANTFLTYLPVFDKKEESVTLDKEEA